MHDQTPGRIDALIPDETASILLDLDVTTEIATARAAIEATGEQRAGDGEIATRRGLLLLFDVLIGITIGTLPHDQESWTRRLGLAPNCGTVRCVAGWLAQIGHPGSRPVFEPGLLHTASHRLADGSTWTVSTAAVAALLDCEPFEVYGTASRYATAIEIPFMFSASANLEEVWRYASNATGGVVTLPETLIDRVRDLDQERADMFGDDL